MAEHVVPESQTVAPGNIHGPDSVRTIVIEPNWENTAAFTATALRDHAFDKGAAEPVISLIETVRYLYSKDPALVEQLIERVRRGR